MQISCTAPESLHPGKTIQARSSCRELLRDSHARGSIAEQFEAPHFLGRSSAKPSSCKLLGHKGDIQGLPGESGKSLLNKGSWSAVVPRAGFFGSNPCDFITTSAP